MKRKENLLLPSQINVSPINYDAENSEPSKKEQKPIIYGKDLAPVASIVDGYHNSQIFIMIALIYNLSDIVENDQPSVFSTTSRKEILKTRDEKRYFLKEKPQYATTAIALRTSAFFQQRLAEKLSFVPRVIETINPSNPSYAVIGNRSYLLTPFVEGRGFNGSTADVVKAASALGKIHSVSMSLETDSDQLLEKDSLDDAKLFLSLASNLEGSENDPWKKTAISSLQSILSDNERMSQKINVNKKILNHGDFGPYNLVYDSSGEVAAVNDFDNVAYYPRVRDLADPILMFCDGINYISGSSHLRAPVSHYFHVDKAKKFLQAYCDEAGELSTQDILQLKIEVRNRWVELMSLGLVRGDFSYVDVVNGLPFINNFEKLFSQIFS